MRVIRLISLSIVAASILLLVVAGIYALNRGPTPAQDVIPPRNVILPQPGFMQTSYEMKTPFLQLEYATPSAQLPDLRPLLIYNGKNNRPDAPTGQIPLHFTLGTTTNTIPAGKPLYINYQGTFGFSTTPTLLWITAEPQGTQATVTVHMKNETGQEITTPAAFHQFINPEKSLNRIDPNLTLGGFKADGALFAKQKGRLLGPDLFMEKHGGDEYRFTQGRERLDFGEGGEHYVVYVKVGDTLVWTGTQWKNEEPGPETRNKPVLVVNRLEPRIASFDLWDPAGKGKVTLTMIRALDSTALNTALSDFHYISSRTRYETTFDVGGQKLSLRPDDWVLATEEGWKKLSTPQEIDDYVNGKVSGLLLVIDHVSKEGDSTVLKATLFNAWRTAVLDVTLPLKGSETPKSVPPEEEKNRLVPDQNTPTLQTPPQNTNREEIESFGPSDSE